MKERIILTPGLNGNELLKNLAIHGINCFNTRIVSTGELARLAFMRSGISISEEFIDSNEQTAIVAETVKDVPYFKNPSFVDIRNIVTAINRVRSLISEQNEEQILSDTLSKGIFLEKNNALIDVYERYMQILKDRNSIDSIMLTRKAISECSTIDAEFFVLKEYPLTALQEALLLKVSNSNYKQISLASLYDVPERSFEISGYKNCYGASNEVESVLADIYSDKNCDECTIAITDTVTYGQLFFDYALLYDIPMTFGCGIPIMNSNPAKLLSLYYSWMTDGFYGTEAIKAMLLSDVFDMGRLTSVLPQPEEGFSWSIFYEVLGQIRFTTDAVTNKSRLDNFKKAIAEDEELTDKNDPKAFRAFNQKKLCIPFLEVMSREFALDTTDFISKYAYIRIGGTSCSKSLLTKLDFDALNEIKEQMALINSVDIGMTQDDIIIGILKNSVLVQQSAPGMIHITSIDKAVTSIRKNIYIVGLSATKYPGSPKENYLLLDEDLKLFGSGAERFTSVGRIDGKKNSLFELVSLASRLGSSIQVSYSGLNVSELKGENASSLIYELFKEEYGSNVTSEQLKKQIAKISYFDPGISIGRFIGKEYIEGSFIATQKYNREERWPEQTSEREFSPSALETYAGCPKSFFFKYIMGLSAPDEEDPFEIISARAEGTLAHSLMEILADEPDLAKEAFLDKASEYFDRYIDEHIPLISKSVESKKSQFLEMMENAYNTNPHREVVLKEEDIHCNHESGIKLHGFPDRVERLEDGTCLIVDYKTGNKVKHKQDDPYTCLQVLVYAYLMENAGYKVSGCEYRYIRLGQTVTCTWDEDAKGVLNDILLDFKHNMRFGEFYAHEQDPELNDPDAIDPCKFCKYGSVCGKEAR